MLYAQKVSFGLSAGAGFNKNEFYYREAKVSDSYYRFSYKGGVWGKLKLTKKISFNSELNYFHKAYKVSSINLSDNYLEIPVYCGFEVKFFELLIGMTNNFYVENNNSLLSFYTLSGLLGFTYGVGDMDLGVFFNRELISNQIKIADGYNSAYHRSIMFSIYLPIKFR